MWPRPSAASQSLVAVVPKRPPWYVLYSAPQRVRSPSPNAWHETAATTGTVWEFQQLHLIRLQTIKVQNTSEDYTLTTSWRETYYAKYLIWRVRVAAGLCRSPPDELTSDTPRRRGQARRLCGRQRLVWTPKGAPVPVSALVVGARWVHLFASLAIRILFPAPLPSIYIRYVLAQRCSFCHRSRQDCQSDTQNAPPRGPPRRQNPRTDPVCGRGSSPQENPGSPSPPRARLDGL